MLAGVSIARATCLLGCSAARKPLLAPRIQWPRAAVQNARAFSVSRALKEKKYTEEHEWVEVGSDGKTCTIGISKYAANALGDVVYIELPENGLDVAAGDTIGSVESVKSASDIMTPVAGKVVSSNDALSEKPSLINKDPEGEAWLAKVELESSDLESGSVKLMTAEEYQKFTGDE